MTDKELTFCDKFPGKETVSSCCRCTLGEPIKSEVEFLKDKLQQAHNTIHSLEQKLSRQKHTITWMQESLRQKNLDLDALHKVWCTGGCSTGVHRYTDEPMTQEIVNAAVANVDRLVMWWKNKQIRDGILPVETANPKKSFKQWLRETILLIAKRF